MKYLFTIISLAFMTSLAVAQKGTIRGVVYDKETGETLIGAGVEALQNGSKIVAAGTDLDGAFEIKVAPGAYTLKTTYISYADHTLSNVIVNDGDVTVVEIRLGTGEEILDEIVLETKVERNNETVVLLMQKNSTKVMDGISSQQIKRMGDSDAAGAIKRVTGVTVEGGKYVTVRGLGDRYSKTLLNGADIPSLDPEKNAVQLDLFPTNLIDNMLVYKTFSPDLPADFTGGLIDLSTKDFPEKMTFQFSGRWGFNDQATGNNNFLTYNGGKTDWLGIDDGSRNAPAGANQLPSDIAGFVNEIDKNTQIVQSFNKDLTAQTKSPFLNQSYSLSVGNQTKLAGKPLGFIVGLTYQKNNAFYDNGSIGRYVSPNPNQLIPDKVLNDAKSNEDVLWGIMANANYKFNTNNKVGLTLLHNQGGNKVTRQLIGRWSENNAFDPDDRFYSQAQDFVERSITTAQLKGSHYIENLGNGTIDWVSSFTLSGQSQPDFRLFAYDWEKGVGYEIKQQAYQPPARFYRDMDEKNFDTKIHYSKPLFIGDKKGELKFGGAFLYKDREFTEFQYDYLDNLKSFGMFDNDVTTGEQFINPDRILTFIDDKNIVTGFSTPGMYMRSNRQLSNTYRGQQSVIGAYAMANLPMGDKWKAIFGVRYERTDIFVESANPNDQPGEVVANDFLPSINVTNDLTDLMKLRFGYNRTIARPTFREMAPFSSYLFAGDYVLVGNPNLDRTLIDNFDVRWEWYPAIGDLISASVFYKRFDKPIERRIAPEAANLEVSFVNVPNANVAGAELEVRKELPFLSNEKNKTRLGFNATYIYARTQIDSAEAATRKLIDPNAKDTRPMYGQSPFIINAYLTYIHVKSDLTLNLSYNIWGERLTFVSQGRVPDVYEQPRHLLDFTLEKGLNDKWRLTFRGQNLLNPLYKQTHDFNGQEYIFSQFTVGRTYSIGVKYSF
jgi:outer membrane receptor protein involved in Fe transport